MHVIKNTGNFRWLVQDPHASHLEAILMSQGWRTQRTTVRGEKRRWVRGHCQIVHTHAGEWYATSTNAPGAPADSRASAERSLQAAVATVRKGTENKSLAFTRKAG
jgi:hypothetical protein